MTQRFSLVGLGTACFALLVGSALVVVAPAQAAPRKQAKPAIAKSVKPAAIVKSVKAKFAQTDPDTTSSIAKPPADVLPGCEKVRRRLWVEGDGWVVRRVSSC